LDFEGFWDRKAIARIGDLEIYFISLDDLIFNKKLAGRPQDLMDAEMLELKKKESN
jgi:hypothetical protein